MSLNALHQQKFDDIRFDNKSVVVEKTSYGKTGMTSDLYRNDVLVARKKVNNRGSVFSFFGEKNEGI